MTSGGINPKRGFPMNRALCLLCLLVLLAPAADADGARIILDSENQYRFALHHMEKEEFNLAVVELERLVYFFPDDERVPEARYLIGRCYLKGRAFDRARKSLYDVVRLYAGKPVAGRALFLIGESYYKQGMHEQAEAVFKRVVKEFPDSELKDAAVYRLGWTRLKENQWEKASETLKRVDQSNPLYVSAVNLSEQSLLGEELPLKDPTTAGVMAGVLPGLGHAYCERYRDGLISFMLNGLFIWATVEAFDHDRYALGGILGFLELGWYSGNIYSAVNCAHKHNRKVRDDFRKSLGDTLNLDLFTHERTGLGLALTMDF